MPRIPEKKIFQVLVIAGGQQLPIREVEAADALEVVGSTTFKLYYQLTGHTSLEIKVKLK